VNKPRLLFSTW